MHTAHTALADGRVARRRTAARRTARTRALAFATAPALVLGMLGLGVWSATSATAAALPAPTASLALQDTGGAHGDADPKPFILAGEDATFDVSLTNSAADAGGYNIGFTLSVPNGIDFVASGLGTPVIYASGATLPNSSKTPPLPTVPAGTQLWVFEDVADLPATADYASTLTVRPDAAVFPVGAAPTFRLDGYVSSDPALKPVFDGSTGVGGAAALAETSSDDAVTTAPVKALRLTKSEPSPEIELLRGVHDHQTVYTLTIENTPQGATDGVTVVDYLPAGLEFLGCADVDNTQPSALLSGPDGTREYPGAGQVTGSSPTDCLAPVSVETVDTGIPADLPAGVYTKVTWQLPALSGATAQAFPTAAGTPGVTTIRYAAAVPLFENTMDFATDAGSGAPSPGSLAQGSNLNNNNGPSTRQGLADGYNDGILYTNSATVAGTYAGPLAAGAAVSVSDTDTERIQAMDLRILKSVDTGEGSEGNEFRTGRLATFTLDLATSEYTSADDMTVVDTYPNGLCPAIPTGGATLTGDPWPSDCAYPSSATGAALTGATLDSIHYDAVAGTFELTFTPDPTALAANDGLQIVYTAFMRAEYTDDAPYVGNTSSGDDLENTVEIEGMTHSVPALEGITNGSGVPAFGDEDVWDDSAAEIVSGFSGISKRVLARDAVLAGGDAATSCAVPSSDGAWDQNQTDAGDTAFVPGDVVCYELTVDFATQIDVRNPLVTDFLPTGVRYLDSAVAGGTSAGIDVPTPTVSGQRIDWNVGTPGADGDRFVPLGSTLVLHVRGEVTSWTPNDEATLDKPENLMKYQQENVLADVFFLRDASAIQTGQGPTLLKGVVDVDGDPTRPARSQNDANGTVFDSDRDGIQVVADDVVTYRVDLTGGTTDVAGLVVWDALPTGITKADVSAVSNGGTALDPGDAGYPANAEHPTRSVIVWTGIGLAAAAERTLTYDVTVPTDVLIDENLVNTASITQYDVALNTGDDRTFYPADSLDDTPRDPADEVPGTRSRDDSAIYTPPAAVTKSLAGTEISPATNDLDPNNGAAQAVQGELITYTFAVTVPAHTSVSNGVLRDRGTLTPGNAALTVTDGTWSASALTGATASDFTFTASPTTGAARGVLVFPATYTNSSDDPQVFTVTLTGYLGDAGANNTTLTNQAQFRSDSWNGDATATVQYREPNLDVVKTATPATDVTIGTPVTYTLTVTNNTARVISYDNVVTDTVPAGLIVDAATFDPAPASVDPGVTTGAGGVIRWNIAEVPATATLTYDASIDPATGAGETYRNVARVTGYTLPDTLPGDPEDRRGERTDQDDAVIEATTATITKGVRPAGATSVFAQEITAPIGDTVQYEVVTTLQPNINYYDPVIADDMPAGAQLVTASVEGPTASSATIDGTWARTHDTATNTWRWTYAGDIASAGFVRTLTLRYEVLLSDGIARSVNDLPNTAAFSWNSLNGDESTRTSVDDAADVDVVNPVPAIVKSVSDETPDPGQDFDYTVSVTNTGTTPAYNLIVTDTVPAGVVVDPATISNGGALTGADATTGGGTITWDASDLPGPLHPQSSADAPKTIALTYTATLAPSATIGDTQVFTNTARVTHLESFPDGGRTYDPTDVQDTATVDPAFPNVTLTKTTTAGDTAYAGAPFGWTLTLVNDGDGIADSVAIGDVLPKNWTYDAGSATIRVGTAASAPLADPAIATAGDVQTLTWDAADVAASPALPGTASGAPAAARTIVVAFTATPTTAALTDAGVTSSEGVRVAHTNTLSAVTTDTSGAEGNSSGSYTGPQDTADAYIHAADLSLTKDQGTGLVAGGAAGTAWTITVANNGPDTAVGPFTVTDDWGTLPDGFVVTGVTGTGWSVATTAGGFTATRTDAADTLADGASFPPITVTARAAAGFDPADAPVANTATVSSTGTYDPEPDNDTDDAEVPVAVAADLSIVKTGPTTAPAAGGPIAWTLTVTNNGPADSVSAAGALITVTDTIPAGVTGVTVGTLPTGWTSDAAGPLDAGDTLTLTLDAGQRLTPAQATAFVLGGTVSSSIAPDTEIENSATVSPGATSDPDPSNNEDSTTTTPTTDTTLGITKTRQVFEGGAWRDATSADETVPGSPVTYLVTVANTGTADARGVAVVDEVPAYLAYTSFASATGTWTRTSTTNAPGDDQTFALTGVLTPGATAALRVTLSIDPAYDAEVVNWAQASADNATNEPRDSDDSDATRSANLSIVKSHTGTAVAGATLPYRLSVTNEGPSYSSGPIVITDTLPAGFGYAAGSATVAVAGGAATGVEPVVDGQTLTWTIGAAGSTLADGAGIVVDFTATIDAAVTTGTYDNVGTVDGPDDTDPSDDTSTDPTPVTTSADLSVVKTAAAGPYVAGTSVTYSIDVTNAGPSVARDVSVVDTVPAGLTVTALGGTGWTCDVDTATCERAVLALGTSTITVTADIAASVPTGTELRNIATVTSSTPDPSGPVTDDATIEVETLADLALVKTAVDADGVEITTADAGTDVRYLFEVVNNGPSDAVGPLTIADTLPAGIRFVSVADGAAAWTCATLETDAQELVCENPSGLPAGASATDLVIVAAIDPAQPVGASTNIASVSSPTPDPVPANNTDDAPLEITQSADLSIMKTHDADAVAIGEQLTFALEVRNAGPSDATEVTVVDTLPAGLEYVDAGASDEAWTVIAADPAEDGTTTITATLDGSLPVGTTAPLLEVTVLVHAEAYPGVVNTAVVGAAQPDPEPADNTSDDPVEVPALATLVLEKTAVGTFQVGSDARYRITLTNTGPTEDPGPVVISDTLPSGLAYRGVSANGAACVEAGGTVTCTVEGPLAVGASVAVELTVAVQAGAFPSVTNTAVVTTPTAQTPDAELTATATASVTAQPLPATGAAAPGIWIGTGVLLLLGGALLLATRRRRTQS
ncbi:isopeptide-forming domain-containing fimbrial protein [Microbacterium sp. NPDC089189]|uniref:isopeptide-forming domain-containing fimbrial protein n=1 Tax=Microbacterium sp. NPDC089189 TaxID=3154972 RepID=UPI00343BCF1D